MDDGCYFTYQSDTDGSKLHGCNRSNLFGYSKLLSVIWMFTSGRENVYRK